MKLFVHTFSISVAFGATPKSTSICRVGSLSNKELAKQRIASLELAERPLSKA